MQLIISEKPAAAEKIAAALGKSTRKVLNKVPYFEIPDKDIIVVPAVGHLFTLAQKEKTWKYPVFDLEWKPTYETEKAAFAKPYLENIKKLAKQAEEFVVATDYDI
jgi:DNA topoisomerase-1